MNNTPCSIEQCHLDDDIDDIINQVMNEKLKPDILK